MTAPRPSQDDGVDPDLAGHRGRLFGLAYRMLGSVADAEDIVQDVAETWTGTLATSGPDAITDPEAWLVTVTTRRCLDRLRSARHRREHYVGPWLPEPVVADPAATPDDPAVEVARADDVSFALLVVLDELRPAERVAFILHDVFAEPYERIAAILDRTPESARQLASRARRRVRATAPAAPADPAANRRLTDAFLAAATTGDLAALVDMLAPDVVMVSDGGGVVVAARKPMVGADLVARVFANLAARTAEDHTVEVVEVNGGRGLLVRRGETPAGVVVFESDGRAITAIRVVVNPDKLVHLR